MRGDRSFLLATINGRLASTSTPGSAARRARAVLRVLMPLDPAGTLVDLGCGKGKVLLVATVCGMSRVRGVEFARELCEIARANWLLFQAKTHSTCVAEVI